MFSAAAVEKVGTVKAFGGSTAPDGWLFCDGSAISRTTYAELFSVIGTTYGGGDGSTTFNIPNSGYNATTASVSVYGNGKGIRVRCVRNNVQGDFSLQRHSSGGNQYGIIFTGADGIYNIGDYVNTDNTPTGSQVSTNNGAVVGLSTENTGIVGTANLSVNIRAIIKY